MQWLGGQTPIAQLEAHHLSMLACPAHAPVALHFPVCGPCVEGFWVHGTLVVGARVEGLIGQSVPGPAVVGAGAPFGEILISAQFTKVSCCLFNPTPQSPWPLHPQLFPTLHHHCNTQWSHVKPLGSTSLMWNFPFEDVWSCQRFEPSGCSKTCLSCSWVIGRLTSLPRLKRKDPWWLDVILILTSIVSPSLYVLVIKGGSSAYLPG